MEERKRTSGWARRLRPELEMEIHTFFASTAPVGNEPDDALVTSSMSARWGDKFGREKVHVRMTMR